MSETDTPFSKAAETDVAPVEWAEIHHTLQPLLETVSAACNSG